MKKITLILSMTIASAVAVAQENHRDQNQQDQNRQDQQHRDQWNNTPKSVRDGFNRDHPGEANARWDRSKGDYHANYTSSGRSVDEYYDRHGRRTFRRTEWDQKSLPSGYDQRVRARYHTTDYRVTKIERPNNPSLFELVLNLGGGTRTVYTDERGNEVRYRPRY